MFFVIQTLHQCCLSEYLSYIACSSIPLSCMLSQTQTYYSALFTPCRKHLLVLRLTGWSVGGKDWEEDGKKQKKSVCLNQRKTIIDVQNVVLV